MSTSKIKKGFTIVEVVCSLALFSILFITALSTELLAAKFSKDNKETNNCSVFIEALRNDLLYNMSFDEVCKLDAEGRYYIDSDNIDMKKLKSFGINALLNANISDRYPYISVKIERDLVLHISIYLYKNTNGKEEVIKCEFSKGNY